MANVRYAELGHRGVLAVHGENTREFLQGVVSNDIYKATSERAIHAGFLTAQGKYLHDFFVVEVSGTICLECERDRIEDLHRRLSMYKLRARVGLENRSDRYIVAVLYGEGAPAVFGLEEREGAARPSDGGCAFVDPRLRRLGCRAILPREKGMSPLETRGIECGSASEYDHLRMSLGVADGSRDLAVGKAVLLENGFDELHGIDWDKGCFLGQELTARMKYRGLARKRLLPVTVDGEAPEPGTPVRLGESEVGEMRSGGNGVGLALLRLDAVSEAERRGKPLVAGDAIIEPHKPDWAVF